MCFGFFKLFSLITWEFLDVAELVRIVQMQKLGKKTLKREVYQTHLDWNMGMVQLSDRSKKVLGGDNLKFCGWC